MELSVREIHKIETVGIVCHDAGGAEMVSEWVLQSGLNFHACLAGPAVNIFQSKFKECKNTTLETLLRKCDWILCGSSWQSDLEKIAVKRSLALGIFVVVYLDHWVNYEDRFLSNNTLNLPNEIWVSDRYALELVNKLFPKCSVRLIDNPYIKKVKSEIEAQEYNEITVDIDILYVCEPIREHSKIKYGVEDFLGYTEESALEFFFNNIHLLTSEYSNITIRPHPSDVFGKYEWTKRYSTKSSVVKIGGAQSLISEIMRSRIVVGCESMAMVVALMAGRKVYSSIPRKGRDCVLPHEDIIKMKDISAKNV